MSEVDLWGSESEVAQSCLTLCDPMGCSLPGSSIHGIFQARVLEWGAISKSSLIQYVKKNTIKILCLIYTCCLNMQKCFLFH